MSGGGSDDEIIGGEVRAYDTMNWETSNLYVTQ